MDLTTAIPPKLSRMARYKTMKNTFAFGADLVAVGKALGIESANEVAVILGIQVFKGIVLKTPVDTGRARANWMISEGSPQVATVLGTQAPATPSPMDFKGGSRIFITNSLPYIVPLEYGHSKQAPAGMVRVTLAEVQAQAASF